MGTVFQKVLFWGSVIAIPLNFFIFFVGYHTHEISLQILAILNIALVATQFLKEDEKQ